MPNYDSHKNIINLKNAIVATVFILVALAATNLVGTNVLSTQGFAVSEAETKTMALEKENQILSVKIEEATTLRNLQSYAEQRGYIRSKSIVFAPTTSTFASR